MTDAHPTTDATTIAEGELFCPSCGYDLRQIASDRCPECGEHVDRKTLAVSLIPWVHRKEIGRARAFLRTVWLATRRPDLIARECSRPVSYLDAKRFRWTVVFVAWLPILIAAAVWWLGWVMPPEQYRTNTWWYDEPLIRLMGRNHTLEYKMMAAAGSLALSLLAALLWFIAASGVASYLFHPRSLSVVKQDRAVALSHYSAAPLALLPVVEVWFVALAAFAATTGWDFSTLYAASRNFRIFWLGAWTATLAVGLLWWVNTLRLLHATTDAGPGKLFFAGAVLPLTWLLLGPLIFLLVHGVVSFALLLVLHW